MKILITLAILFTLFSSNLSAQWESDVRLTNFANSSYTSYNNAWNIASSGNIVHTVWWDNRLNPINYEIYYKRSTDAGITWGADTRLTNAAYESWNPSMSVSGASVNIVWQDRRDVNDEIYTKRSADGGNTWEADIRLTNNSDVSTLPSVTISGSVVHTVWDDTRDGNAEIYYKRSTDGGVSWGADTRLTFNSATSNSASVTVSGSIVHVTWQDRRFDWEIFYKRSTDGGVSWGTDTQLTNNAASSWYPSVSVSGSAVHIVWQDSRDGNEEIYYKRSTDDGVSWESDIRLTTNVSGSWNPSVSVSGSVLHVVWNDYRIGSEIWYKRNPAGSGIPLNLNLISFIEGFYNSSTNLMVHDTARVYLRNNLSPYAIVDSAKSYLSSTGAGTFSFQNASNGVNYYLHLKHRNSIETWSKTTQTFTGNSMTYDFTTANTQAYGNNMMIADASPVKYAIYSGDVNQEGIIDLSDVLMIYNDANVFGSGYVVTDVTGNGLVDLNDVLIAYNNSAGFVAVIRP